MAKGQITVFIIIGIVFLLVMGIIFWLNQSIEPEPTLPGDPEDDIAQNMHSYARGCMEEALKSGLRFVGFQGGVIYDYQADGTKYFLGPGNGYAYGQYILPYTYEGQRYNVSYALTAPIMGMTYHPELPLYPYGLTKLITNPKLISPNYVNTLGNFPRSPFSPLCDFHGSNRRELSESVACETYDSYNSEDSSSVQEFLERYIEVHLEECISPENAKSLAHNNYTVGNATCTLTFGDDDVYASARIPIHVISQNERREIFLEDLHAGFDVRLKKIHELVSHLVTKDSNDVFFNIVRDAATLQDCADIRGGNAKCLRDGMTVKKISNACFGKGICEEGEYDDILIVEDEKSTIDGQGYTFMVAIENRPPAIDLIRQELGTGSFRYDYILTAGDSILIEPRGYDPDEDQHGEDGYMEGLYFYYDWKEGYTDYFYCPVEHCNIDDTTNIRHVNDNPKKWSLSTTYSMTKRNAGIKTTPEDIGVHTTRVEVCDEEGLCDWQAVMILVTNGSFVSGYNNYDLPGKFASLEDPYNLASPFNADALGIDKPIYHWTISDASNVVWAGSTTDTVRKIPFNYDISNIKQKVVGFFPHTGTYAAKVDIMNPDGTIAKPSSQDIEIAVKECLPHRSIEPSYPYQSSTTDPFKANHTCCLGNPENPEEPGWGTIAPSTQVCYRTVDYGCRDDPNFGPETCSSPGVTCSLPTSSTYSDGIGNDIYMRDIARHCSGRGNTCEGQLSETRTRVKECNECQTCVYSESGIPECEDRLSGEVCNAERKCSAGNGQVYGATGVYNCQATCSFGDCTKAINCECSSSCGAECENDGSYLWNQNSCDVGCDDCMLTGTIETKCKAPDINNCQIHDVDGQEYYLCPELPGAVIDSEETLYASYCRHEDVCHVVSCNRYGVEELEGDYCPAKGTVEDVSGTEHDSCFHSLTETKCDVDGTCNEKDEFGYDCNEGSPVDGTCVHSNICESAISCNPSTGWSKQTDYDINIPGRGLLDCRNIDCNRGYYATSGQCYYNIECMVGGWRYTATEAMSCSSGIPQCSENGVIC